MYRSFALVLLLASSAHAHCHPRAQPGPCNAIVADLGLFVVGAAYERAILPRLSIQIQAQYYRPWPVHGDVWGFGSETRLFVFLGDGGSFAGPYLSTFARLTYVRADGMSGEDLGVSAGATAGVSFTIDDLVILRAGAGIQCFRYSLSQARSIATVYPTIDLNAGIAF